MSTVRTSTARISSDRIAPCSRDTSTSPGMAISALDKATHRTHGWRPALAAALLLTALAAPVARATSGATASGVAWRFELAPALAATTPPLPPPAAFPVQLVVDDDVPDGSLGVSGQTARQFLWFNRFSPGAAFALEQIWVLFPAEPTMAIGDAIDLVVYEDADGDPQNGATLLATFARTVQAVDGNTFSVYDLTPPVALSGDDVLIGVVPRFIVSGVDPPVLPASFDTTASQGRSWLAVWSGDPPDPAQLTPAPDLLFSPVDVILPANWLVRGFGDFLTPVGPVEPIPSLSADGLAALALLLALAAFVVLARRRQASQP